MAKVTLPPVTSGYNLQRINDNFKKIEDNINNHSIQRDNKNNTMNQDLDMDGNKIVNVFTDMNDPNSLVTVGDMMGEVNRVDGRIDKVEISVSKLDKRVTINEGNIKFLKEGLRDVQLKNELEFLGEYRKGLTLTKYNQVVRATDSNGNTSFWRASSKTKLPYTLTGEGVDEHGALVNVGDALLRDELSGKDGFNLVGSVGAVVDSVKELKSFNPTSRSVEVLSYHKGEGVGGGVFTYSNSTTEIDGGIFIESIYGGVWKRITSSYSPYEFGALSNKDSYEELSLCFSSIKRDKPREVDFSGDFKTSQPLVLEAPGCVISGNFNLESVSEFESPVLKIVNSDYSSFPGKVSVKGLGGTTYNSRGNRLGVLLENSRRVSFAYLKVESFKWGGVMFNGEKSNVSLFNIDVLVTIDCGSGRPGTVRSADPFKVLEINTAGDSSSLSQMSEVTLRGDIPKLSEGEFLVFKDQPYEVMSISGSKVELFPWLPEDAEELHYLGGGGLITIGGDASNGVVGQHDAFGCSSGQLDRALYPVTTASLTSQSCFSGVTFGRGLGKVQTAKTNNSSYFELCTINCFRATDQSHAIDLGSIVGGGGEFRALDPSISPGVLGTSGATIAVGRGNRGNFSISTRYLRAARIDADTGEDRFFKVSGDFTIRVYTQLANSTKATKLFFIPEGPPARVELRAEGCTLNGESSLVFRNVSHPLEFTLLNNRGDVLVLKKEIINE